MKNPIRDSFHRPFFVKRRHDDTQFVVIHEKRKLDKRSLLEPNKWKVKDSHRSRKSRPPFTAVESIQLPSSLPRAKGLHAAILMSVRKQSPEKEDAMLLACVSIGPIFS